MCHIRALSLPINGGPEHVSAVASSKESFKLYLCVYVCVCVCVYIYIYIYIYISKQVRRFALYPLIRHPLSKFTLQPCCKLYYVLLEVFRKSKKIVKFLTKFVPITFAPNLHTATYFVIDFMNFASANIIMFFCFFIA